MDEATYERWWPLHLRASKGEPLTAEDRALYESGLCHLHRDETLQYESGALENLYRQIATAERKNADLDLQRDALEKRLAQLLGGRKDRQAETAVRSE